MAGLAFLQEFANVSKDFLGFAARMTSMNVILVKKYMAAKVHIQDV